ncbi:MAG TPA: copper oxidase [Thermoanaerobaculia bacterium]|nr:copper oxidase [Thermoanaerobaculia bacterium]
MAKSRRDFLRLGVATAAGLVASRASAQHEGHHPPAPAEPIQAAPAVRTSRKSASPRPYVPVEVPDVPKLPWRLENGVKVFHLVPEVMKTSFTPWKTANTWGYNGSTPGPTIEVQEGDRVRIVVENRLPEATVMHWHGLEVPNEMDGVEGLIQDFIAPGETFAYEFTLHQHGTFFYHSHRPMQQMMGMIGLFVVHPKKAYEPHCDRDFGLILQEWATLPNNPTPNTLAMEFNWLTINGKSAPATTPMLVKLGERVRLRMVNLGMDHHPMHMHGHTWVTTGTEGGRMPRALWRPGNTELVGVAQARDVEFVAHNPGDWMLHCHLPHHMMNAMVSMVGPMSEPAGGGVPTGAGMEEGMGMITGGHAMSHDLGPSMGRTTGVDADQPVPHLVGPQGQGGHEGQGGHGDHGVTGVAPNARQVPGYPQDMWMVMDKEVEKPETYGLRPTWTGAMMGMMTIIRVLKPEMFDKIQELKAQAVQGGAR